jgi:hypothetical protein
MDPAKNNIPTMATGTGFLLHHAKRPLIGQKSVLISGKWFNLSPYASGPHIRHDFRMLAAL